MAVLVTLVGLLSASWSSGAEDKKLTWMRMDRWSLQVAVDLASDTTSLSNSDRDLLFEALYEHLLVAHAEWIFADELLSADPEQESTVIVASEGDRPLDYLFAARRSYARFKTAETAGQREWISTHHTAAKKYVALAAEALRRRATENETSATALEARPYGVRRASSEAERLLERIKRDGLTPEQQKWLAQSGLSHEQISAYQEKIQATPAAELGISPVGLWRKIADARRQLAASLDEFARKHRLESGPLGDSFLLGNPRDSEAVVQVVVRRVAMPVEWTVSLSEAQPAAGEKPPQRLKEVEKGRRYEVRLPAKGEIRLVSEVTPVGVVAENTTARWAIEGRIGEELLGGIVQEVNVPGFIADLQLPGIAPASQAQPVSQPAVSSARRETLILIIGAALLLAIGIGVVTLRSRKRS